MSLCRAALCLLVALLAVETRAAPASPSDQAVLSDGREVSGTLQEDSAGRIVFNAGDGSEAIPLEQVRRVRFATGSVSVAPTKRLWRLNLWADGQILTGRIAEFRDDQIKLDLLSLGEVTTRRGVLAGVHSPATEHAIVYHDFEGAAPGWSHPGEKLLLDTTRHLSGASSLRIEGDQATLAYNLPQPLEAGRVELSFWDEGGVHATWQWLVEAEFQTATGPQRLRVLLGWNAETFGLEAPDGPSLPVQQLVRRQGWRRLRLSFSRQRSLILVDDAVLTAGEGPRGPLRAVRLVRRPTAGQPDQAESPESVVGYVDDFTIYRYVDSLLHPRRQWDHDELLLASGDQLFGHVEAIDDHTVTVVGSYGTAQVPWSEVRGVMFMRQPSPAEPIEGIVVKLSVQARLNSKPSEWDSVEGVLESVTPTELVLRHPYLGLLHVPRRGAREMEVVYSGWRLVIDPAYHHLGDAIWNIDPSLPLAEGSELRASFHLGEVPARPAFISLRVADLEGIGPGSPYREELEQGHLRTDLSLNGQKVDFLNRFVERRSRVAQRIRVPVPAEVLRRGENVLELRQRPTRDQPTDYDNFQLFGIALEVDGDH